VTAIVIGATAGLGKAVSRALAADGQDVALVARDPADLAAEAAHLRTVHGVRTFEIIGDGEAPDALANRIRERLADFGAIGSVLFPIGAAMAEDDGTMGLGPSQRLLAVNLVSVIAVTQAVLPRLMAQKSGVLVGFGSVAAVRGRGGNVIYAASKRALESYFESLRHRLSGTGVRAQFYRLGYLDTRQSFGKRLLFPRASPDTIAGAIVAHLGCDRGRVTLPAYWRAVTLAIRVTPWPLFRRVKF